MCSKLIRFYMVLILTTILLCSCSQSTSISQVSESSSTVMANFEDKGTDYLVLKNCYLIDGTGAAPVHNATITIKDGLIKEIDTTGVKSTAKDATIIDLKGAAVLPGFINTHVHKAYDAKRLQKWLKSGVTTVRDLSPFNFGDFISEHDKLNSDLKNAHLLSANPILAPPGGYGSAKYSSTEDAGNKALNYIQKGVDTVKFSIEDDCQGKRWPLPKYDEVKRIVDTAHANNKRTSVHITHSRNLKWAIDAGVDEIAHMVLEPLDNQTINKMVEKNIYWVPTMELWKNVSDIYGVKWIDTVKKNVLIFHDAGGKIALGTDYAGYSCSFDDGFPITEVSLMSEAGLSNMEIIIAATKNAAFTCGISDKTGTLEVGKKADVFIVDGDPLIDIKVLKKAKMVIHEGKIIKE